MSALILVRYGELALKSPPVRREFERALQRNIIEQFASESVPCRLRSDRGHFYVEAEHAGPAVRILRRVFGVTSVSEVVEVPTERSAISATAIRLTDPLLLEGRTFAVRARRTGQHPFTSQELAGGLGSEILERFADRNLSVDLDHPAVELFVEVRDTRTYLYTGRHAGPGGLPLGFAGRVVALVDGRRGALGAYLLMKRGCRCALVPTAAGLSLVDGVLRRFDPQLRVAGLAPPNEGVDRSLLEEAESSRADGLALPLAVDDYPDARARWGDRVIFSPTVGLTDEEVQDRWLAVERLAS